MFWKYNFIFHMSEKHVIWSTDSKEMFAPLYPELVITTRISLFEEKRMEIPSMYTNTWRRANDILDSDAIIEATAEFEERESRKRGASDVSESQASTASRQPSPSKKYK